MHNFNITKKSFDFNGQTITAETGKIARQANGAIFISQGDTTLLVTATMNKTANEGADFFPLTVDYVEKMYAAGKVPGGFIKRESRPSNDATLTARVIDRALRPMFPDGFRNSVHVVVTILAYDGINDPAMLGLTGASLALTISDIPFHGPIAGVAVGYLDGKPVVNPSVEVLKNESDLHLSLAGSATSICMIESSANELSEEQMVESVFAGFEKIKELVAWQVDFAKDCSKEKAIIEYDVIPVDILNKVTAKYSQKVIEAAVIKGKLERDDAFSVVKEELLAFYKNELGEETFAELEKDYNSAYEELIRKNVRQAILHKGHRVDGRGLDDVRAITCEVDTLPRVHGSALFTRGETQSLGTITLAGADSAQIIDGLKEEYKKDFYLHYNFPPYSVGEAGFMRGPGRRELGHGNLAETALIPVLPAKDVFPYTIRIVSEITESNGSSSQASICSGSMALMAAGVPIKAAVAGIANGLIMEGNEYVILTDIMGLEDHLGDMDFKVAGTRAGITAMQMDIKIEGITQKIMKEALQKAHVGRHYILDKMEACIPAPRTDLSEYAPRIVALQVPVDKIGEIIGQGGKTIKSIIEQTGVDINIDDDGIVNILSADKQALESAKSMIKNIIDMPKYDTVYEGVVSRIEAYGAFVKIMDGFKEGLVHISNMHDDRVAHPEDICKVGDTVYVKLKEIQMGKIGLSMKGVPGNPEHKPDPNRPKEEPRGRDDRGGRDNRGRDSRSRDNRGRDDRGGDRDRRPNPNRNRDN
ncbi:MAG: polyribonucleotide nucleotidyltransferase [Candidatus Cloacimonadales bacterium]